MPMGATHHSPKTCLKHASVHASCARRPGVMATGRFERVWFDLQANVAMILAARAGAALEAVARAKAQEGRAA